MIIVIGEYCSYVANRHAAEKNVIAYLPEGAGRREIFNDKIKVVRSARELVDAMIASETLDESLEIVAHEKTPTNIRHLKSVAGCASQAFKLRKQHLATIDKLIETWRRNVAANARIISTIPHLGSLDLSETPVIAVGPGPSLSKNIDDLRRAKGRSFIIALNRAAAPLCRVGIYPDAVIVVDAGKDVVIGPLVDAEWERIGVLILEQSCDPSVFALPARRKLWYEGRGGIVQSPEGVKEVTRMPGGATVAASAVGAALACGSKMVATVGIDLALEDGKRYASYATHDDKRELVTLKHWSGSGSVKSPMDLYGTYTFFVEMAKKRKDVRFYNCTEGGAFVPGWMHVKLKTFTKELRRKIDNEKKLSNV